MRTQKIRYGNFCLRLSDQTKELLKKKKKESGKSWNRYIYSLIKENENEKSDPIRIS